VTRDHRERGSATVLMCGVLVVAVALMFGAARLGMGVVAKGRADTAADAAALAAADMLALGRGAGAAAAAARDTASDNGARLVSCRCDGSFPSVVVAIDVGVLGAVAHATARAEVHGRVLGGG
jgi:secretion/DNA translocation related TadE-like protein